MVSYLVDVPNVEENDGLSKITLGVVVPSTLLAISLLLGGLCE